MRRPALFRMGSASLAAATVMAMSIGPAAAAPTGPYVFDSLSSAQSLTLTIGLPDAIASGLADALDQMPEAPGVSLDDGALVINLSGVLTELAVPLQGGAPGALHAVAAADPLTGSLDSLLTDAVDAVRCVDAPTDITIPPDSDNPIVSLTAISAECIVDEDGRLTVASSNIGSLEVNLGGLLAVLPAEVTGPLTDALTDILDELDNSLLDPIRNDLLNPIQDAVNDALDLDADLSELIRIPDLLNVPLLSIASISSSSTSFVDGDAIRSVASSSMGGVQLLGTLCIPSITYRSEAWTTGLPGGNGYIATPPPPVDVSICDTANLDPILRLLEAGGLDNDVLVSLGGELRPLGELLEGTGLPVGELFDGVETLLSTLGVTKVLQGTASGTASDDGRTASAAVSPLSLGVVNPLGEYLGDTPLGGLSVVLAANDVDVTVAAAPEPPAAPDEPEPALPRTGAGALATMLGVLAMGGALSLRRRD